jgi:hypothetical protein
LVKKTIFLDANAVGCTFAGRSAQAHKGSRPHEPTHEGWVAPSVTKRERRKIIADDSAIKFRRNQTDSTVTRINLGKNQLVAPHHTAWRRNVAPA